MNLTFPIIAVIVSAVVGAGLSIAGIYLLVGLGCALLASSVPFLVLCVVLMRGLLRGVARE